MLTIGIRGEKSLFVDDAMTAQAVGSGGLAVFSTPTMIALMEATAMESVCPHLAEGQGTVGTEIHARHVSATPVGLTVRCASELIAVDGRRLTFSIEAYDEAGLIGTASHERYLIDNDRFLAKALKKLPSA